MKQRICLVVGCILLGSSLRSQLMINEVSASCNTVVLADDNGKDQDWLEIYNTSASPVNASAFYITDNAAVPLKWNLPNVMIAANGFMRVYCSGENRITGSFYHSNFKLNRPGDQVFIFNASSVQIDNLLFGDLDLNHSFGRSPDGSATTGIFTSPTPNASNTGTIATAYCPTVSFSLNRGFYASAQSLTLTCPGYDIRYTTNGSEPTTSSSLYVSAVPINTTMVIKAKSFPLSGPFVPCQTLTRSYFIGETQLGYAPVVSISMEQVDFNTVWNTTNYSANFYPEKKGHYEYWRNKTQFDFETDFNLKLHGTTSTNNAQKGMRLTCEGEYNNPSIKDTLFKADKPTVKKFGGFNLRHDQGGGGMWDPYATQIANRTNIDYLAYRPCIVFVNGQYYGEYQLREIGDEEFIENNHPSKVNKDSLDLLRQNLNWATMTNSLVALAGSDTAFFNHLNHINSLLTPSTQAFYDYFKQKFDEKNWFDYFVTEIYVGNTDWLGANAGIINNIKLWRSHRPSGRWRYIVYDCDYSIGIQTVSTDVMPYLFSPGTLNYHGQIFKRVMMNPTYKNYFINRFADLLNTTYQPTLVTQVANNMRDSLDPLIQRHLLRWGSTTYPQWQGFWTTYWGGSSAPRLTQLRNHIQSNFTLTAQVTTTFEVYPAGAGTVMLNTIQPPTYPWSGVYYNGAPITIKSKAATGYVFDHWNSPDLGSNNQVDSNTFNVNTSQIIKLYFVSNVGVQEKNRTEDHVSVFPNPAGDQLFISAKGDELKSVRLYSSTGALVCEKEFSQITSYEDVSDMVGNISAGIYIAVVETSKGKYYKKLVLDPQ